jgi:UDPglucose 6-dehydrogenase
MGLRIGVFGLGFVGLTTALGFAEKGFTVRGFDRDPLRLGTIAGGRVPFLEPGLDAALRRRLGKGFQAVESAAEAAEASDVLMFCVGTPCGERGKADLGQLFAALDSVFPVLEDGKPRVLVIKSTVPPGTTADEIIPAIRKKVPDEHGLMVANNPEFLREGKCWDEFIHPDRIVCGLETREAAGILRELYGPFNAPLHFVSLNTAEFIKYLSNTMLATLISYANELSLIADKTGGIDTARAFHILHEDKRLKGSGIASYLYPGCGYGGYCLPKDTQAMAENAHARGIEPGILRAVMSVNDGMPAFFVEKIKTAAAAAADTPAAIGILGLSFKPESDDVRDSPAAKILKLLLAEGYTRLCAFDPVANEPFAARYRFPHVRYLSRAEEVCAACAVLAVVSAWKEFTDLPAAFPGKTWIDARYCMTPPEKG